MLVAGVDPSALIYRGGRAGFGHGLATNDQHLDHYQNSDLDDVRCIITHMCVGYHLFFRSKPALVLSSRLLLSIRLIQPLKMIVTLKPALHQGPSKISQLFTLSWASCAANIESE